jgi:hypothetical protein
MKKEVENGKSCGPQLFDGGEPNNEWKLEELGVYARKQYRQILDGEKLLSLAYWRLGHALVLAKEAFQHGKWAQYLEDLKIDKTRASKARAIYRTFDNPDEVAKLTVEEAYAKRQRKQSARPEDPVEVMRRLRTSLRSISKRTGDMTHDAKVVEPEEIVELIPSLHEAIVQLIDLLEYLQEQANAAPVDAEKTE